MAKCKECIHYESCSDFSKIINSALDVEKGCEHFKNSNDFVEVVHGRWRKVYTCHGEQAWGYECDQCKADNPRASYYCPNCGAKMDLEGKNDSADI